MTADTPKLSPVGTWWPTTVPGGRLHTSTVLVTVYCTWLVTSLKYQRWLAWESFHTFGKPSVSDLERTEDDILDLSAFYELI